MTCSRSGGVGRGTRTGYVVALVVVLGGCMDMTFDVRGGWKRRSYMTQPKKISKKRFDTQQKDKFKIQRRPKERAGLARCSGRL
jgi:hypothetical protein